jgi:hypothetical protein
MKDADARREIANLRSEVATQRMFIERIWQALEMLGVKWTPPNEGYWRKKEGE